MTIDIEHATGDHDIEEKKTIIYPFEKYEVEVDLSPDDKFLGISGIKINRTFLTQLQKQSAFNFIDVDSYYREADKD